jgi:hypothetical protein
MSLGYVDLQRWTRAKEMDRLSSVGMQSGPRQFRARVDTRSIYACLFLPQKIERVYLYIGETSCAGAPNEEYSISCTTICNAGLVLAACSSDI